MNSILLFRSRHFSRPILLATALICSLAHLAVAQEELPPAASAMSGPSSAGENQNFQTDLFTGRFNYHIPIVVPTGRQGSEPRISLGYNSGSGNGWCGVGWNLDMGFIQRDTRKGVPLSQSIDTFGPPYDNAYGFTFSFAGVGANLVHIGGNEYRSDVESAWLKFRYVNPHWEVTDKGGNRFYFGNTTDSRMENTKSGWTPGTGGSTFRWALNETIDVNGNRATLTYSHSAGQMYLSGIAYNGNVNTPVLPATHTVDFLLEDRPDTNISYQAGFRIETQKRLSEIIVKAAGANVRRYGLQYSQSPSTLRSLLKSVTQFGTNNTSSLLPLTFGYQEQKFEFGEIIPWFNVSDQGGDEKRAYIRANATGENGHFYGYVDLMDIDGDGLPDRVASQLDDVNGEYRTLVAQRNQGLSYSPSGVLPPMYGGFAGLSLWGRLESQVPDKKYWNGTRMSKDKSVWLQFVDMNADGYPDRLEADRNDGDFLWYQQNSGIQHMDTSFTGIDGINPWHWEFLYGETTAAKWKRLGFSQLVGANPPNGSLQLLSLLDINGDGRPDRIMRGENDSNYRVTLNGHPPANYHPSFGQLMKWKFTIPTGYANPYDDRSKYVAYVKTAEVGSAVDDAWLQLRDINGDGLPDHLNGFKNASEDPNYFRVQFNNGGGFEDVEEKWGPVHHNDIGAGGLSARYIDYVSDADDRSIMVATLADMNGDGLPDRVSRKTASPYTNLLVQLNTGTGFGSVSNWNGITNFPGSSTHWSWYSISASTDGDTYLEFIDIDGDGLPDRVMREKDPSDFGNATKYDAFMVQLNKGPFPDLLCVVSNGIGGHVKISYTPSTRYDNRDKDWTGDPWTSQARSLLPFPVYTVASVTVESGFVTWGSSRTTTYSYRGGMFDPERREFRGFNCVAVTDPVGTVTRHYFHQGGGRNETANGEYLDAGSIGKKGKPYRIELWGSDNKLYRVSLNKVEETVLHANGWSFPYISQTVDMDFEGLPQYRARAKRFVYDAAPNDPNSTGNLIREANLGEVTNVVFATHEITDIGNDALYTHTTYTNIPNPLVPILNRPHAVKFTTDEAGSSTLREARTAYDLRGNSLTTKSWLNFPTMRWVDVLTSAYDQYGNLTNSYSADWITTGTIYDAAKTFPITRIINGWAVFTSHELHDVSGNVVYSKDAKGLVTTNLYDVFFRPIETRISTTANGQPTLWKTKTEYNFGGVGNEVSQNYVLQKINDVTDANGHQTYTYSDGLGRPIQTRVEAETGYQYRTTDVWYTSRGSVFYKSQPYFSEGATSTPRPSNLPGIWTAFDPIGRPSGVITLGDEPGGPLVGLTFFTTTVRIHG